MWLGGLLLPGGQRVWVRKDISAIFDPKDNIRHAFSVGAQGECTARP
jgi:hypothetical protein